MFFIMGITSNSKQLNYLQTVICNHCGKFGRLDVFMTYSCVSLFFMPVFKWNKKYYAISSCCSTTYSIDFNIGKQIEKCKNIQLNPKDLHEEIYSSNTYIIKCPSCSYPLEKGFEFCPKCGRRL